MTRKCYSRREDSASIRALVSRLMHHSGLSRDEIAKSLSEALGQRISPVIVYQFCAASRPDMRWPAEYDIALCELLGDYTLLEDRVRRAGFRMVGPEEERLIKIGRAYDKLSNAKKALLRAGGEI